MTAETGEPLASVRIDDGIAYVALNVAGEKVNTLSTPMVDRFEEILDSSLHDDSVEAIVIHSTKPDNFVVGFDIEELQGYYDDPEALKALVDRGHALMDRFADLDQPVVAAIHGKCLGGGLELALACHARVASDSDDTAFGLPEVMLGLIPGGGGTQRLPRLIDLQTALDMIMTGREINGQRAKKLGLVDDLVHPGILLEVATEKARELARNGTSSPSFTENIEEAFHDPIKLAARTPARKMIFDKARQTAEKKSGGHYPALSAALDVVETGFSQGFEAGLQAESEAFVELVQSDVAHNLMKIFFMRQDVNKDSVVDGRVRPYNVQKIGVLGAGLMGAGIAQVAAYNGYNVRMKDRDHDGLGWGINYVHDLFGKLARRKKISQAQSDVYFGRVSGTTDYSGFKTCDLVVEAVFESLEIKRQVLADIEALGNEEQVFASNTSTIPIAEIAAEAARPENVLGMHFFSPVYKMPLLEIIRTDKTHRKALATALAVGREMGKTCIVVDDGPGFFTSRVIGAYINEAGWILQEGARVEDIDRAMRRFGFPVGPLKLVDEVGLDVAQKAAGVLQDAFSERWDAPTSLEALAKQGRKGRKNDQGFYDYAGEGSHVPDETVYDVLPNGRDRRRVDEELVQQRCWLAMLNECAYALQEGILRNPRDGDIGVIFGLGFPPFRGGIFRHADEVGIEQVVDQMNRLSEQFGERLLPAEILVEMAHKGETFYND